ncbi:MAG: hypothetical protein QXP88_00905 [Thermoproteota archaeon]
MSIGWGTMFPFILESSSLYTSKTRYFVVKVTEVNIQKKYSQVIDNNSLSSTGNNLPFYNLKGKRIDASSSIYTIIVPAYSQLPHIEIGDFILATFLEKEGYGLYIGKLYSKIYEDTSVDQFQQGDRFLLPHLQERPVAGQIFNENIVYLTYYPEYISRKTEEDNYIYDRIVRFPSYQLYKRYLDLFQYDQKVEEILDSSSSEARTRRYIFEHAENPLNEGRNELKNFNNDTDSFIFRPDIVIDRINATEDKLVIRKDSGIELFSNLNIPNTDKYPNPFIIDDSNLKYKIVSYDEVVNNNKTKENKIYYQKEFKDQSNLTPDFSTELTTPFFPKEFYEIKIGRNKFSLAKLDYEEKHSLVLLKSQADQSLAMIADLRNQKNYSYRIRNYKSTITIDEIENTYSRLLLSSSINQQIEVFENPDNKNYINILSSTDTELKKIAQQQPLTRYSNIQVGTKEQLSSLTRTNLAHKNLNNFNNFSTDTQYILSSTQYASNQYSDTYLLSDSSKSSFLSYQAVSSSNYSYIGSYADSSSSEIAAYTNTGSNFAKVIINSTSQLINLEISNNLQIKIENNNILIKAGSTTISLDKDGNITSVVNNNFNITGNLNVSKDAKINQNVTATGFVKGSKFIGTLICTGAVVPGATPNGSISVECN